jgi:hypothetical protein
MSLINCVKCHCLKSVCEKVRLCRGFSEVFNSHRRRTSFCVVQFSHRSQRYVRRTVCFRISIREYPPRCLIAEQTVRRHCVWRTITKKCIQEFNVKHIANFRSHVTTNQFSSERPMTRFGAEIYRETGHRKYRD